MNDDVDMDLLVDDQPNPEEDFAEGHNKENTETQSQADKNANELNNSGIAQDGSAKPSEEGYDVIHGTESFIQRTIGLSAEDLDELTNVNSDKAEAIANIEENAAAAVSSDDDDGVVGGPADVTVVDDNGDATSVSQNPEVNEEIEKIIDAVDTPAEAQAVECLRRIFSRESEDGADVSVTVDNGEQNTTAEFNDDSVTISPADSGDDDLGSTDDGEGSSDTGSDDDTGSESGEGGDEGSSDEGSGDEGDEGSEESWLNLLK